uniref:Uncharacterized protein n=1 Tax=Physcomitrium patens TaxID=3218 RepID=A0A2K1JT15_PHYPA|nr:hypothetical protein PHYPA_014438 [Physcomitrium patens]
MSFSRVLHVCDHVLCIHMVQCNVMVLRQVAARRASEL